ERRRHRNAESTGDLASGPLEAARERVEILEQRTSLLEQRRAFLGELEPARRAVEEPHAEPLLEALQALARNGQGKVEVARGGRDGAELRHAHEEVQVVEPVHLILRISRRMYPHVAGFSDAVSSLA